MCERREVFLETAHAARLLLGAVVGVDGDCNVGRSRLAANIFKYTSSCINEDMATYSLSHTE